MGTINKKLKFIIKIFAVLLIVLLILSIIFIKYYKKEKVVEENKINEQIVANSVESYLSDKITPQGISKLYSKYKGENDLNEVYKKIYSMVNYLPIICKLDSQSDIEDFYKKNRKEIESKMGIVDKDKFVDFVKYVKSTEYNGEKFYTCKIDTTSLETNNNYFSFPLNITFENFSNEFKIVTSIALKEYKTPIVYFSIFK